MWIGGAAIMLVLLLVRFFAWTRETRPSGGLGWLESARRTSLAAAVSETAAPEPAAAPVTGGIGNVDEDDEHLAPTTPSSPAGPGRAAAPAPVATQDTVTQLVAAIRKVARMVPGAGEVIAAVCRLDYSRPGKPARTGAPAVMLPAQPER
jgi:hypothetical protein